MGMKMEKILGRKTGIILEKNKKVGKMEDMMNERTVKLEYNEVDYVWANYQPFALKSFRLIKNGQKINVQLAHPLPLSYLNEICQPISIRSWLKKYRCNERQLDKYLQGSQTENWGQEIYYLRE